jgi:predicted phage terminase large subunit-like protein
VPRKKKTDNVISIRTKIESPPADAGHAEILEYLQLLERVKAYKQARDDFLTFCRVMMPSPDDADDPTKTAFQTARHHEVMAHALEKIERGELPRLIVCMPPRHGKSQMVSKLFLPWYIGRNPYNSAALATYNSDFAGDFGREVRAYIQSARYQGVFPELQLRKGSAASDRMTTTEGGTAVFVGAGGALTGRGFHVGVIDDPFKDGEEADSQLIRDKRWDWFTKVFLTRQMTVGSSVVITLTRWHEDDIVGRLTDPQNPHYVEEEAQRWKIINFPFFAEENDPLDRQEGEVLWPARFSAEFGEAQRRINPRGFQALYQQRPTAQDGTYFRKQWFLYYDQAPKKDQLRIYAASDHATGTAETNDKTAMVVAGVDAEGMIYMLDCVWGRYDAHQQVEKMLELMKKWKPQYWFSEKQHMGQAIGPFLRKRKMEEGVVGVVEEVHASKDKQSRARSLQGLMADGRVLWPRTAWWRMQAEEEILKFPQGTYDDFVDAASWLGMKIQQLYGAHVATPKESLPRNTWGWWKKEMEHQGRSTKITRFTGGW